MTTRPQTWLFHIKSVCLHITAIHKLDEIKKTTERDYSALEYVPTCIFVQLSHSERKSGRNAESSDYIHQYIRHDEWVRW